MPSLKTASKQPADDADDRARKLAAMQSNASELEQERRQRVADAKAEDERVREQDEKVRSNKARFVSGLHRQAGNMNLGESLRRHGGAVVS